MHAVQTVQTTHKNINIKIVWSIKIYNEVIFIMEKGNNIQTTNQIKPTSL